MLKHNIPQVQRQLKRHMAVVARNVEEAIPAVATFTTKELVKPGANPVLTGKSRSGRNASKSTPVYVKDPPIVSAEEVGARAERNLGRKAEKAYVTNGVPYVTKLEAGSSSKAPNGFVRQAFVKAVHKAEEIKLLEPGSSRRVAKSLF